MKYISCDLKGFGPWNVNGLTTQIKVAWTFACLAVLLSASWASLPGLSSFGVCMLWALVTSVPQKISFAWVSPLSRNKGAFYPITSLLACLSKTANVMWMHRVNTCTNKGISYFSNWMVQGREGKGRAVSWIFALNAAFSLISASIFCSSLLSLSNGMFDQKECAAKIRTYIYICMYINVPFFCPCTLEKSTYTNHVRTEIIRRVIAHQASLNTFSSDIQETLRFYYQRKAFLSLFL